MSFHLLLTLTTYTHNSINMEMLFCNLLQVAYQKNLQLGYVDKLLTDIQIEFRDKYKDELEAGSLQGCDFDESFHRLLKDAETQQKNKKTVMRSFGETKKAQRIRENKGELAVPVKKANKKGKGKSSENDENKENVPGIFILLLKQS